MLVGWQFEAKGGEGTGRFPDIYSQVIQGSRG